MLLKKHLLLAVAALAAISSGYAGNAPSAVRLTIGPDGARPLTLAIGDRNVPLSGDGGFRLYDATTKAAVTLAPAVASAGEHPQLPIGDPSDPENPNPNPAPNPTPNPTTPTTEPAPEPEPGLPLAAPPRRAA